MRRLCGLTAAIVCMLAVTAQPASAGFWSWLEEFSGPGPLKGQTIFSTACVQDERWQPSPIAFDDPYHRKVRDLAAATRGEVTNFNKDRAQGVAEEKEISESDLVKRFLANPTIPELIQLGATRSATTREPGTAGVAPRVFLENLPAGKPVKEDYIALNRYFSEVSSSSGPGHSHDSLICGYFDFGRFSSEVDDKTRLDNRGFPKTRANLFDFGFDARVHDGIDIGAGAGWLTFTSSPLNQAEVHRRMGTLTPLRVLIRPVLLVVPEECRKAWMGVFSFYWKETYVYGKLKGADFGLTGPDADRFIADGELLRSYGVTLDLSALLPRLRIK